MLLILTFPSLHARPLEQIREQFTQGIEKIFLDKIQFACDIAINQNEFRYLTGLESGQFVTQNMLEMAYERLLKKKRFQSIQFQFIPTKNGVDLKVQLNAHWIIKKIVIKGILFGKYRYASLYQQQPGEEFDVSVHEDSIKSITTFLYDEGYFNARIEELLEHQRKNKMIAVRLNIKRGKRFDINDVCVVIEDEEKKQKKEQEPNFSQELSQKLTKELKGLHYSRETIEKEREKIKQFIRKRGYFAASVKIKRRVNAHSKVVDLKFIIKFGQHKAFQFEGNSFFSAKYLNEQLVSDHGLMWLFDPNIAAERIAQLYYSKGYRTTKVSYSAKAQGLYCFKIVEGDPLKIKQVIVVDEAGKEEKTYKKEFEQLIDKPNFDEDLFNAIVNKTIYSYFIQGYWDCSLKKREFKKEGDADVLYVELFKGQQRFVRNTQMVGIPDDSKELLLKKLNESKKGELVECNPEAINDSRRTLIDYYKDRGYWYADAQPELVFTAQSNKQDQTTTRQPIIVDIIWHIEPGEQVLFGKIVLRGTTRLPLNRILAELPFAAGEPWSKKKLDLARSRLRKLSIFKQVQVQPHNLTKKERYKDVIITLLDDDPIELRLRTGYFLTSKNFLFEKQSTYELGGTLLVKNPTNGADKLTITGDFTRFERMAELDYQRPRLFGSHLLSGLKAFTHSYVHPVSLSSSKNAYEALQHGVLASISNEYQKNYYLGITLGNEWLNTKRVRGKLKLDPKLINHTLPYFSIEPTLVVDAVDDRLNPTKGGLGFFSLKMMFPEKRGEMTYRLMLEQALFYPIYDSFIAAVRFRFGHIFGREFDQIMPIERFYLGGPYTVRGYEKDAVPPLGVTIIKHKDGTECKEFTIQGGRSMVNINLELRFPIYSSFGGVVFHDIGSLNQEGFALVDGNYVQASGIGLRYNTPIGPFRFDIGRKWDKSFKEQSRYVWYLTLGHAF